MLIRKLILACSVPLLPLALSGCIAGAVLAAGIGAGAVGADVATDTRGVKQELADRGMSNNAHDVLKYDQQLHNRSHINVATYDGNMLLAGQVQSDDLKQRAGELAANIQGVKKVYNELTVAGNEATLVNMNDAWITSKVKTMMIRRAGLRSEDVKVVTINGVVYLMGDVSRMEASNAADAARRVDGVNKVVEVFSQHS